MRLLKYIGSKLFGYRKPKNKKPIEDMEKFFAKCTEDELSKYINEYVDTTDQKTVDYAEGYLGWGHAITFTKKISNIIYNFTGFYSGSQLINNRDLRVGDIILRKTLEGKIVKYLIIHYEQVSNPRDMFHAYVVGIGYK